MDAVIVGLITAVAALVALHLWRLLVRPEDALSWWGASEDVAGGWFSHHPGAVRALRVAGAGLIFLLGFLTGLMLVMLPNSG